MDQSLEDFKEKKEILALLGSTFGGSVLEKEMLYNSRLIKKEVVDLAETMDMMIQVVNRIMTPGAADSEGNSGEKGSGEG